MFRWVIAIVVFFFPLENYGQGFYSANHNLYVLPGYSPRSVSIFSLPANAASVAQLQNTTVGISSMRRFMLSELGTVHIAAALINSSANFALNILSSGFPGYRENEAGLNAAKNFGETLDAGIRLLYCTVNIPGYGRAFAIGSEAGMIFHLSGKVHAAIQVKNPVAGKFSASIKSKLASFYSMGVAYEPSLFTCVNIMLVKEEFKPLHVNAGFVYQVTTAIRLLAGINTSSTSLYWGTGIKLSDFMIEVMAGYHQVLGFTPQLSVSLPFKKKQ